jgi:plastocyanin
MPTRRRVRRLAPGLALAVVLLLGIPTAAAADRDVTIVDFAYAPAKVMIRVGDSVTWTNRDPVEHSATATNGAWDTGLLGPDASGTVRFTQAGTYAYLCTPHPSMTGTVVVRAASGGGSGGTSGPPDSSTADGSAPPSGTDPVVAAGLALIGIVAWLAADRRLRRRRGSATPPATR